MSIPEIDDEFMKRENLQVGDWVILNTRGRDARREPMHSWQGTIKILDREKGRAWVRWPIHTRTLCTNAGRKEVSSLRMWHEPLSFLKLAPINYTRAVRAIVGP